MGGWVATGWVESALAAGVGCVSSALPPGVGRGFMRRIIPQPSEHPRTQRTEGTCPASCAEESAGRSAFFTLPRDGLPATLLDAAEGGMVRCRQPPGGNKT